MAKKKKAIRKKRSKKARSTKGRSQSRVEPVPASTRVVLKEVAKSKKLNVRFLQLGQAMESFALASSVMSTTRTEAVRMPVRESYSLEESKAKTRVVTSAARRASARAVPANAPSIPPGNNQFTVSGRAMTNRVVDRTSRPYSAVGRIDVTAHPIDGAGNFIPGGSPISWMGSGFVVGERTVYSAAHVLETPTRDPVTGIVYRITSATFRPQHPSMLRSWAARHIVIHDSYFGPGLSTNLVFDMAAMVTDPNDVAIQPVTGRIGWKTAGVSMPIASEGIGYPSNPPTSFGFDGNTMWRSLGQTRPDSFVNFRQKDNDMTRGCSGGPWVIDAGGADGFVAIGLNSHVTDTTDFNPMISPIFDDDFLEVLRGVQEIEDQVNGTVDPASPDYKKLL